MTFSAQRGRGKGNFSQKEETITSIQEKDASSLLDKENVLITPETD